MKPPRRTLPIARLAETGLQPMDERQDELRAVIRLWPRLTKEERAQLVRLVEFMVKGRE